MLSPQLRHGSSRWPRFVESAPGHTSAAGDNPRIQSGRGPVRRVGQRAVREEAEEEGDEAGSR
ncbi:hypothetical protein, partial [Streptomyces cahuitamycinicus]|uniref:hypothetical protein n=1 Tax=Streptomyces cahuitamycinicus TaxID=2070367 RepID=UPI001CA5333E